MKKMKGIRILTAWALAVMMVCTSLAVFAETHFIVADQNGNILDPEVNGGRITYGSADTELIYVSVLYAVLL